MFRPEVTIQHLQQLSKNTMVEHLGIEFIKITDSTITAKMPVDHRTHQPFGLLHGGASVALAETLGSVAAQISLTENGSQAVGLEINANHIKSVREGWVFGTTRPIHVGKKTQVWEITITNEKEELVCISRITVAVISKN